MALLKIVRVAAGFVAAVGLAAAAGSAASTHFVLSALQGVGAVISQPVRLDAIRADLAGFAPSYAALIAIAFIFGFGAAYVFTKMTRLPRLVVFTVAGGVAVATLLYLAKAVFWDVSVVAGARSLAGFLVQVGVGAAAGLAFALVSGVARPYRFRPN